jgi:2'-5' RNA ligase
LLALDRARVLAHHAAIPGKQHTGQLQCLAGRLGEVRNATLDVLIGELGCFDRAGVFFADVVVSPALADLQQSVVSATSACGFVAEFRPFHPHITLARTKGNGGRTELRALCRKIRTQPTFTRFTAHEFVLYESQLGSEGSRYEIRGRFPLSGRNA